MPALPPPASLARLRAARKLTSGTGRRAARAFLADGAQCVREALALPGTVRELFVSTRGASAHPEFLGLGVPTWLASEQDVQRLTDTVTPQGIVAVCAALPEVSFDPVAMGLVLIAAQVRDPGNAGALIRCADAFGADAVVLTTGSVDLYNPKVVRASVGSLFHLPIVRNAALGSVVDTCRDAGLRVLAGEGTGEARLDRLGAELARPTAWLFGNEAWGLPARDAALADARVAVPIFGRAESLNLATAAAVCLYASATAQRAIVR